MKLSKNKCLWLMNGRFELCGKPCVYELCKQHRAQLKRGQHQNFPCRNCGIGVISECRLCSSCGASRVQHKLVSTEKRARKVFSNVLRELVDQNNKLYRSQFSI